MSRDVPIANAMLCWNAGIHGGTPSCAVVRHPDTVGTSDAYSYTVGACFVQDWPKLDERGKQLQLLIEAWHAVAFYSVPVEQVHEALLVVPEYRSMLASDCLPARFQGERS